jgi:hypothetical protein
VTDPMERILADALDRAGLDYVTGDKNEARLDFYLPSIDLYIEVKQFHSARIAGQMSRAPNVIAAQGELAVRLLANLIEAGCSPYPFPLVVAPTPSRSPEQPE